MNSAEQKLDSLTNAILEDILKAPDEEVLADALIEIVQKERAGRLAAEAKSARLAEALNAIGADALHWCHAASTVEEAGLWNGLAQRVQAALTPEPSHEP